MLMVHVFLLFSFIFFIPKFNQKRPLMYVGLSLLFLFLALRYNYGNDYSEYMNNHSLMNDGLYAWGSTSIVFNKINVLFSNFFIMIAVLSFFYLITIFILIKKQISLNMIWFSILILLINPYLFLIHSSSIRQTLAICVFVYSVRFAIERKYLQYFALIIIALGIHPSSIILFPFYFIMTKTELTSKFKKNLLIVLMIIIFTPAFDVIANITLNYLPNHYSYYFSLNLRNGFFATAVSSIFFFFILYYINILKDDEIVYAKLSLIATIFSLLAYRSSMITRIGMYFDVFLIVSIPQIFMRIESVPKILGKISLKNYKSILFGVLLMIYLLRYYSFFTNPMWESFVHYRTILGR